MSSNAACNICAAPATHALYNYFQRGKRLLCSRHIGKAVGMLANFSEDGKISPVWEVVKI